MAIVEFYEKPGCSGNARQKALLKAAGHTVVAHDLLTTAWERAQLRSFFGSLPVAQWFNRNAPKVKRGEIVPTDYDENNALTLFLNVPILIRRPLLEVEGVRHIGFDEAAVHAWIGLGATSGEDQEICRGRDACRSHDDEYGHACKG